VFFSVLTLTPVNGLFKQVSVYNNEMWGVRPNNSIATATFQANGLVSWTSVSGNFKAIYVGPTLVWGHQDDSYTYACNNPCSGGWYEVNGILLQISMGLSEAWAVLQGGLLMRRRLPFATTNWLWLDTFLVSVSCGTSYVYGLDSSNQVYQVTYTNNRTLMPGVSFVQISASLQDDSFFGIGSDKSLTRWTGSYFEKLGIFDYISITAINQYEFLACTSTYGVVYGKCVF
jgi:hypothetical protein